MIDSRSLDDLLPCVRERAIQFIKGCERAGCPVLVYCTYRDHEMQDKLYARGRTVPGRRVTNARGGYSWHNFRAAFDFVPMVGGKPQWSDDKLYARCGEIGEACGLEWGGRFKSFRDAPHMQYTGGLSLAEVRGGAVIV